MTEWLALALIPILGTIFLTFSAWAEGNMLQEVEAAIHRDPERPES
jgi:hypothetical protein